MTVGSKTEDKKGGGLGPLVVMVPLRLSVWLFVDQKFSSFFP